MKSYGRTAAAVAFTVAATLAVAALSRVSYGETERDDSLIRLSWRTPGELVNECRRLTAEELERLPIHMRREEVCEGRIIPYRLRVTLDGRLAVDDTIHAAGAREDRPLYVYREIRVPAGEHRISVVWEQERGSGADGDEEGGDGAGVDERVEDEIEDGDDGAGADERGGAAVGEPGDPGAAASTRPSPENGAPDRTTADRLTLDATVLLAPGQVSLITYDLDRRELIARGHGYTPTAPR